MLKKIMAVFIVIIGIAFIFYACDSPPVFAQADTTATVSQTTDATILTLIVNAVASVPGLAAFVLFITAAFKKLLKTNNTFTIVISAIVSAIISYIAWLMGLGIFAGLAWWYIIIYGLAAMLIANGLSTWSFISGLLKVAGLKTGTAVLLVLSLTTLSAINMNQNADKRIDKHSTYTYNMQLRN